MMEPALQTVSACAPVADAVGNHRQRDEVAYALSHFLASTYMLYQKSLFYHWNAIGANLVGLNELFEQHYHELHHAGNILAERIRALGHASPGTVAEFLVLSAVPEDKKPPTTVGDMIKQLLRSHEICSKEARIVLRIAGKAEDEITFDLMVQRMAFHDKAAWTLRALQA